MLRPVNLLSISGLKSAAGTGKIEAAIHVQIESVIQKQTRDSKPYYELGVVDAGGKLTLRAWSDAPGFSICAGLEPGGFLEIRGEWDHSAAFGVESKRWTCRELTESERRNLLDGPAEVRARQQADWEYLTSAVYTFQDPRLRALAESFLLEYGDRFRRTAAARNYHHARRGGLVEHTAQMLRCADALCGVYPRLNRDLLLAGALFHDTGKLWENSIEANGFLMPFDERGEMLGHIAIGLELVNTLWEKLRNRPDWPTWSDLQPASDDVRLHLLHLVASHHGEMQFGSPVFPKTPEAHALHYIDNLDARLEMIFAGYESAAPIADRIYERVRPLPGNLVEPLPSFPVVADGAREGTDF
jgi:3'-5' exoribonuclease